MTSAREVAVLTLAACEKQGAWSDGYLKKTLKQAGLDRRDAALATRLCFGVLQNRLLLDFYLGRFSSVKPEKLEPRVRAALRIALYQLLMMDKIPPSAAVNESVSLARKHSRNPRAAGLVNAVLRAFLRAGDDLPPVIGETPAQTLSLKYSHPLWLVEEWVGLLGPEGAEALLRADNEQPPTTIQINPLRAGPGQVAELLTGQGVEVTPHPWLENCLTLTGTGDLERLEAYRQGLFYVQDAAARLAVEAAGLTPGSRVLDCCAAPGGKSFAAAIAMEDRGEVVSCDIHPHKIKLIEAGRDRLGLSCISPREQNARSCVQEWVDGFDAVVAVQRDILDNVSRCVRPGGTLLYSTCTLREQENEGVVEAFLADHPAFAPEPFTLPGPVGPCGGMRTLWPHVHGTDGFFIAKLRRQL